MRTPRDSTYARVAAGGDYDADWEEHYAPPPPPNLKRAAQAPKKIATVGAAGPDRWARDDYYTADPYQSFAPLEVDSELSSSEDGTPRKATVQPTPPRDSPVDVWAVDDFDERGDSQASLSSLGDDAKMAKAKAAMEELLKSYIKDLPPTQWASLFTDASSKAYHLKYMFREDVGEAEEEHRRLEEARGATRAERREAIARVEERMLSMRRRRWRWAATRRSWGRCWRT